MRRVVENQRHVTAVRGTVQEVEHLTIVQRQPVGQDHLDRTRLVGGGTSYAVELELGRRVTGSDLERLSGCREYLR